MRLHIITFCFWLFTFNTVSTGWNFQMQCWCLVVGNIRYKYKPLTFFTRFRLYVLLFVLKADSPLGWLIIFKCFRFISPWKRKLSNSRFRLIFIFIKKEPQSCQFATYRQNALFEFLTSQTGQMTFPSFKVIIR